MQWQVPKPLGRLAIEAQGWLEFGCPDRVLDKTEALLRSPGARPVALYLRIRALIDLERYDEALRALGSLRGYFEDRDWLDLTEAWCRKRLSDLPGAITCIERLLDRSGRSAIGHFNLGCYLALCGEHERAIQAIDTACSLEARYRELASSETDLESLRGDPRFDRLCDRDSSRS